MNRPPRGDPDPAPKTENGIEHRPDGPGKGPGPHVDEWVADAASPPEEPLAIGLPLEGADRLPVRGDDVGQPDFDVLWRSSPTRGEQNAQIGDAFRLDKQI